MKTAEKTKKSLVRNEAGELIQQAKARFPEAKSVTLFFATPEKTEEFAVQTALCMTDSAEFEPAELLNLLSRAKAIRLGEGTKRA